jgi:YbgC/YbaW family acyl-CoA thioester hydrolase
LPSNRVTRVAYAAVHEKRIAIRWRDLDAYRHVNQAVYLTYLEEIVDDWLRTVLGLGRGEVWNYVAAHVSIDYRAELRLEDREAVGSARLERVGTKSVTARVEIRAPDGRLAAEAELVVVARDSETGASTPLSDRERAAFAAAAA